MIMRLFLIFCNVVLFIIIFAPYGLTISELKIPFTQKKVTGSHHIKIYKLFFSLPEELKKKNVVLGVGIEVPAEAEEVYLNGHRIGERGELSNNFVIAPPYFRIYKFPSTLLYFNQENVIEVKALQIFFNTSSCLKRFEIASYDKLQKKYFNQIILKVITEVFIFTFLSVIFLILVINYIYDHDKVYLYTALSIFLYMLSLLLESCFFYLTDLKNYVIQKLSLAIYTLVPLAFFYFFKTFLCEDFKFTTYITSFAFLFSTVMFLSLSLNNLNIFMYVWSVFLILYFFIYISLIWKAYRNNTKQLKPMILLLGIFVISYGIGDMIAIFKLLPESFFFSFYIEDYAMLFWSISILYMLFQRFFILSRERHQLAARILTVQEEERRRLASDLHDSLGQNLLSIKFKLQGLKEEKKINGLENIICAIDESVEMVREISYNLRPTILDRLGIEMAFQMYVKRFEKNTNIKTFLTVNLNQKPSSLVEINIFRIMQESLVNIFKHAQAKNVFVYLYDSRKNLILRILDDGVGFNYEKEMNTAQGLGLYTMQERINLLNGKFLIKSRPRQGTEIFVEVPLDKDNGSG